MTTSIEEAFGIESGEMDLSEPEDAAVELEEPVEEEDDEDTLIEPEGPTMTIEEPPVVQLSFAERVSALVDAMASTGQEFYIPEPENMTVIDYYDRAHGGQGYLGKLYLNADTGAEYKLVTMGGQTIMLGQLNVTG